MAAAESKGQSHIVAGGIGVDYEHLGALHRTSLPERDPGLGGWTLDLHEQVCIAVAVAGAGDVGVCLCKGVAELHVGWRTVSKQLCSRCG